MTSGSGTLAEKESLNDKSDFFYGCVLWWSFDMVWRRTFSGNANLKQNQTFYASSFCVYKWPLLGHKGKNGKNRCSLLIIASFLCLFNENHAFFFILSAFFGIPSPGKNDFQVFLGHYDSSIAEVAFLGVAKLDCHFSLTKSPTSTFHAFFASYN